jgi:hypothetical protein
MGRRTLGKQGDGGRVVMGVGWEGRLRLYCNCSLVSLLLNAELYKFSLLFSYLVSLKSISFILLNTFKGLIFRVTLLIS